MRKVRILFCLGGILFLLLKCTGEKEPTRSTLLAIKGKVILNGVSPCCNLDMCNTWWWNCPDGDAACCSVMNPYQEVKVSVFFKGNLVEKKYTDENGNFLFKVPPGIYDVKIYPPHNLIDTHGNIEVKNTQDTYLGNLYYTYKFPPQVLFVDYYPDVTKQRLEEIMLETSNAIMRWYESSNSIRINVSKEYHPQEMIEILEANYPQEIRSVKRPVIFCLD